MQHRHCVEAVDCTLRDICDSEKPFRGITVVLGGDFRQIFLVIPKGVREQIVNVSLRHSVLWKHICILTLDLNMRLNHEGHENANFANFLMEIGTNPQEIVNLPSTIHKCQDLNELLSTVYPQLNMTETSTPTPTFLTECTILSACNDDVSDINTTALNIFPGRLYTYLVEDKMSEDNEIDPTITNRYPNEVNLRIPVFSHGQLYVALSRCTSFDCISILLPKDNLDSTTNIIYPEDWTEKSMELKRRNTTTLLRCGCNKVGVKGVKKAWRATHICGVFGEKEIPNL
ncbi:uncharacterized protein LOC114262850 [Camellia sinensis]|uniref:uncharacterized protein LOC114262850 n=1 Tax=Camellia sinensis TaxID=4442 RepID=UPI001036A689|nr:uncharacterized protein LOC114262850 [Camellia sinensis]